MDRISLQAVH